MAKLTCTKCNNVWDASTSPFCPTCLEHDWDTSSGFIRPKHDPQLLPMAYSTYRSVVTMDFIVNKPVYINEIVYNGEFYYDNQYGNFTCFINQPLGMTSGSGIPANYPMPTHPLDSQKVVDVFGNPHVYAVDMVDVINEISTGRLDPPRMCEIVRCTNLAIPGTKRCSRH